MTTIKGYHPLHLIFPASLDPISSLEESDSDEDSVRKSKDEKVHSYIYLKPHQTAHTLSHEEALQDPKQDPTNTHDSNAIIFVANVPSLPDIQSSLLLQYIFERFGNVNHVVIVPAPRRRKTPDATDMESPFDPIAGSDFECYQDRQAAFYHPGKYAHVHFESSKERKRALQRLTRLPQGIVQFDSELNILGLKELSMASMKNYQKVLENDNSMVENHTQHAGLWTEDKKGIHALVQWHQRSIPCRTMLQKKCDEIMASYEEKEQALHDAQKEEKQGVADKDGFITVSYKTIVSSIMGDNNNNNNNNKNTEFMAFDTSTHTPTAYTMKRRSTSSRGASKKERKVVRGSEPLPDFYKFQSRESRKRSADELKAKFQQDLQRVKKMREEREYRPF